MIYLSKTKTCSVCGRCGAFSFNDLCSFHWSERIEENILRFIDDDKKKKGF